MSMKMQVHDYVKPMAHSLYPPHALSLGAWEYDQGLQCCLSLSSLVLSVLPSIYLFFQVESSACMAAFRMAVGQSSTTFSSSSQSSSCGLRFPSVPQHSKWCWARRCSELKQWFWNVSSFWQMAFLVFHDSCPYSSVVRMLVLKKQIF